MKYSLKELRARKNMGQKELAHAINTSLQTISNYEMGKYVPNIKTAVKIAEVLGVKVEDIKW